MSDEAEKKPTTPAEIREAARKRAIQNLASAISYLEVPDSEIDEQSRAGAVMAGIAGGAYALANMMANVREEPTANASSEDKAAEAASRGAWVN